jgi:hypothetical protein
MITNAMIRSILKQPTEYMQSSDCNTILDLTAVEGVAEDLIIAGQRRILKWVFKQDEEP